MKHSFIFIILSCIIGQAHAQQRARPPLPAWYPEYVADCVVIEKKEAPIKSGGFSMVKYHVKLADDTREVRDIALGYSLDYERASIGQKVCTWNVGITTPLSNDNLYLRRVAKQLQ
jgi:hypothetical protein